MGRTESPNLTNDYERACGWYGHFNQSEMALFSECSLECASKLLDTADIVREAIYHQMTGFCHDTHTLISVSIIQLPFFFSITTYRPAPHNSPQR